ncbi:MAG: ABC transporter substrate-binding protein [Mesorhizobium sp.]
MHNPARLSIAFALALGLLAAPAHAQQQPAGRVVSMNLCTDQLAMLIAAPGQLRSVSWLAADPEASALASDTKGLILNHGLAEEIFLMQPDLVLSGTFTTRATVDLLRKLGIRVEEFAPESSLADIRQNIIRMGEILRQPARANEILTTFDAALAEASASARKNKTAATYFANSYTAGSGTLVDSLIAASGLENIAARMGFSGTARLPLEVLLLAQPDVLIDAEDHPTKPALAQENFVHPAYLRLAENSARVAVPSKYTICGGPFTVEAIRLLRTATQTGSSK